MQITCNSCEKKFKLPPEKVPTRRFSFTCPKCGNRIKVDPIKTEALRIEELRPPASKDPESVEIVLGKDEAETLPAAATSPASPAPQEAAPLVTPPQSPAPTGFGEDTLPVAPEEPVAATPAPAMSLRPQDRRLLSDVAPAAYIVHLDVEPSHQFDEPARRLGLTDVVHFNALEEATEALLDAEAGLLLIRMERCPPPPCEPLAALHALPFSPRRRTFVVLEADNVKTLNGQVAFFLQVNCLLNREDHEQFSSVVQRAMLHHLRLYQHWDLEAD